jgi:phosphate transport system ATP-binding protein
VRAIDVSGLDAWFGPKQVLHGIDLAIEDRTATAIIGPSGCGKSTLIRCLNRLHEEVRGARVEGKVLFDGQDIYAPDVDPVAIRRRIGMVFQRPNPFPTMSILDNAVAGLRLAGGFGKTELEGRAEKALRSAGLWDEVKDRLKEPGGRLSGGQQQRLCIARALATSPHVLLLDEPTASLDPLSTQKVEELVYGLRSSMTVIIVTHNMQQAARVSDRTAFMLSGELVEAAPTRAVFTTPSDPRTEAYITGRFG